MVVMRPARCWRKEGLVSFDHGDELEELESLQGKSEAEGLLVVQVVLKGDHTTATTTQAVNRNRQIRRASYSFFNQDPSY